MNLVPLIRSNLAYYWHTNLAVVLGVAIAVAVLAGALLVGDSVRASLKDLVGQRLGNADYVITSTGFFREQLAADIQNNRQFAPAGFAAICPLIAVKGTVTHETSKRVGSEIQVYGVDERFWKFQGRADVSPHSHEVLVSEGLAQELGTRAGDSLLLRVEKPSAIPIESLQSRKDDLGSTIRLTVRGPLAAEALGEFSVQPQQGAVRAVFVSLELLQKELLKDSWANKPVNLILVSEAARKDGAQVASATKSESLERLVKDHAAPEDFGIKLTSLAEGRTVSVDHESRVIGDSLADTVSATAKDSGLVAVPFLSYLANSISGGDHAIPYSLVTTVDERTFARLACCQEGKQAPAPFAKQAQGPPPILLNEWAARDLGVHEGDKVTLEYYLWREGGHLETRTADFTLLGVLPIAGLAADQNLVPEYPGISTSASMADWDPPFPVDLKRIRKQDEDYWKQYRTTPKAFIPLSVGQALWGSRFGKLTSIRLQDATPLAAVNKFDYRRRLLAALKPAQLGFAIIPARQQGVAASQGATDFGEYFLYFSFFLVISALLLTALFFKLGVEQRLREIGLLQALGFPAATIRALFLAEGLVLAVTGSLLGLVGALAYGELMMLGLRTWWVDAVGTTMLRLHVSLTSLLFGAAGGVLAALLCIVWTLRQLRKSTTRSLLAGAMFSDIETSRRARPGSSDPARIVRRRNQSVPLISSLRLAITCAVIAALLLIAAAGNLVGQVAGFFGGGTLLMVAFLCYLSARLRRTDGKLLSGNGWWPVARVGFRNATYRPGRSVLCIALIASAAFIIVSVDAFRHRGEAETLERKSGTGGFPLLAHSLLPLVNDPNTREGREALNLGHGETTSPLSAVTFARFRVRPGDDASCLNLYQPRNPRIIAPTPDFISANRFVFASSIAASAEEKANPWLLLNREFADGAVPVIADANSLAYVLHLKQGEDLILSQGDHPVRLRVVGALSDSIFQSELLMGEKNFLHLFPDQEGYRFFLIEAPGTAQLPAITAALEERLADFGFDVQPTSESLANFHRVENTYLSTFQMLGALGLILGTLGMAAVLLRNVLERRRELALLRAVGYNSGHFTLMILAENALLLCCGLVTGIVSALLAIAPVLLSRHAQLPGLSLGLMLLAVLLSGMTASVIATWVAFRAPLLSALRAE